ncbi:tropomyosin alpha-1 chain-like isoform X1 [Ictalurus furcatus]|uniref:tropomyosin alpha-1 chain-like isoform X1 n=1 Tax=Ictalurus furcatus TaxID=66913 RepID=UPI0023504D03|nr:tropomyosin alpha-1 chain-like isoform X1 [Ictalurus furcatus]XP_053498673.1 tropomyosin alpha-1 chain-like isoform X1 [Ictalurus furcatus]XP_053498674.1 tropomyosin alpha-1 chain-like isoform X1 [Ictalurus furcatus]
MSSCRSLVGLAAYATGAIVMAAGGYYYVHKCGHEERRTEAFEGTPVDEDPVQIVSSGFLQSSDGHKDTQMDKANPEGCLEKAEEKDEEDEVSVVQLNSEELHVPNLVEKVTQLEKLFSVVHRKSEIKSKELEQERQAQRVLKEKYEDMKNNLEHENSNLKDQVKTLQGSVEKLEGEPHEMCEEKLKSQKCELMKLEEIRRNMEEMLFEVVREFKKERKERERERQYYCDLLAGYEDTKERLEYKNSNLKDQVTTLHGSVEKLERELHETQQMCEEKLRGQKCELMNLEFRRKNLDEMLFEVVRDAGLIIKSCLDEAEERAKIALESNAQLEHENSNLKDQVTTLQGSVEKLERELHETQQMCEEKLKSQKCELMKLEEIRRNMEEMLFEVVREFKKERKEREREQKDHTNLLSQYEHIKGCPADTQKNAQNTQRCSTLEKEMLTLMEHLKCMQGLLEDPVRSEL